MREMALNHAAVWAPESNREEISEWLRDVAIGISQLVDSKVVEKVLRTSRHLHETPCLRGFSLYDAYVELGRSGYSEECSFLMGLSSKTPLLRDIEDRFHACEFLACEGQKLSSEDGDPLLLSAITDGVAIGFPSAPPWDRDQVTVSFRELLPDETFEEASEEIDHLARSTHAGPICERHRARHLDKIFESNNPVDYLWDKRQEIFPNLIFGKDVKNHLRTSSNQLQVIVKALEDLEHSARDWKDRGGAAPPWKRKVTDESDQVKNDPTLSRQRRFRSHDGTPQDFFWHARFGSSGRIHLRVDPERREVEIGYIGKHLPLKKK